MANHLTGDFDAVVQISMRQINGLLATLHQMGADIARPDKFPRRAKADPTTGLTIRNNPSSLPRRDEATALQEEPPNPPRSMDWLVLSFLIPLVVVPVVLWFGFSGCFT